MKISLNWLRDFVDLPGSPSEIAGALTLLGFAVEGMESCGEDQILDVDVTTNRPDCLSHLGLARELAARFRLPLTLPDLSEPEGDPVPPGTSVTIQDPLLCPRYSARILLEVSVQESPDWLKQRLEAVGQRPINNIVDVTNYVLFEVGHPLHAFDLEKLEEERIVVRTAQPGEELRTLDGFLRRLQPTHLVICDARRPVALGGILGGEESEISSSTRKILLESAYFQPQSIRATARELGLRTEASYRFERGADPEMPVPALNRACQLLLRIGAARCLGPVIDEYPGRRPKLQLSLRGERIRQLIGVPVQLQEAREILQRLEFQVKAADPDTVSVQIPSFRGDVTHEADLIEEIARHYGYDRIDSLYPPAPSPGRGLATRGHDRVLTRTLTALGFFEAVNYVFTNPERETRFFPGRPPGVCISNPLSETESCLRSSLLPGLVESVRRNLNHGNEDVRLFEVGKAYFAEGADGPEIREEWRLGLVATGSFYSPYWSSTEDPFAFPHLKGAVEAVLKNLGIEPSTVRAGESMACFHPGLSAEVQGEGARLGILGELHPELREHYKFPQPVYLAEIFLEPLYARSLAAPRYQELGRFPSVKWDLSFLVDKGVEFGTLVAAVQATQIPELRDVQLIDLFQGQRLPKDKISLTVRLIFAHSERTLTQEEVRTAAEKVLAVWKGEFGVEPRS